MRTEYVFRWTDPWAGQPPRLARAVDRRATHPCPLVRSGACSVPCYADDCRDPHKHEEATHG